MAPRKNDRTESVTRSIRPVIPPKTIYRMSIYMRCLQRLKQNQIQTVSSEALASAAGVKSTQLRKDLTYFGQFGTRGLGYDVDQLSTMIGDLLGTNRLQPVVLIGAGHLGTALLSYRGFEQEGFELIAAFDAEPHRERDRPLKTPVYGMDRLPRVIRDHGVKMAVLTVPAAAAQAVANQLVDAGISGILNFSPSILSVPDTVMVKNVNLAIELEHLSYFVQQ